jgi:hypothetical protein
MKHSSGPRKTANLSESVHQQLNICAIAAFVAVLSALALAGRSEAKIVYTPVNVRLGQYSLDVNNDGITDFTLQLQSSIKHDECGGWDISDFLSDVAAKGNGVVRDGGGFAAVLGRGAEIGSSQKFTSPQEMAYVWQEYEFYMGRPCHLYAGEQGDWLNVTNGYLGLEFQTKGKTHYGWARLSVQSSDGFDDVHMQATLTGYAYETIAGKSIKAGQTKGAHQADEAAFSPHASLTDPIPDTPQPATLGVLAMGAPGLWIWRREETLEGIGQ